VAILGILAALVFGPALKIARAAAAGVACASNLRQIGSAFHMYAGEHGSEYPPVAGTAAAGTKDAQDGKGGQWDVQLMPYLSIPENKGKTPLKKSVYYCPGSEGDPSYANKPVILLSYTYNANVGRSETSPGIRATGAANLSSVMLLADLELASSTAEKSYVPQTGQGKNNTIIFRPAESYFKLLAARHNRTMNILFMDGHVDSRRRVDVNTPASPPQNVRWTPDGPLTSPP
jgi:prepilin-type processing-associated H-X9-DG protein